MLCVVHGVFFFVIRLRYIITQERCILRKGVIAYHTTRGKRVHFVYHRYVCRTPFLLLNVSVKISKT